MLNADPDATCHQRQLGMRTGNLYRQFDSLRYASRLEDKLIKAQFDLTQQ